MKYAIIGDIHGNLEAMQVVLAKAAELKVEKYICIGDIVGYNANPRECLEIVRGLDVVAYTKGNHDEQASSESELVGFNPQAAMAIEWTRQQLTAEQKTWLAELPYRQTVTPKITVVHATLDMPHMWGYVFDKLTASACLSYQFTQVCFFGHTHVPLAFEKFGDVVGGKYEELTLQPGHKYLVNAGSVGQPRDGDPRASFATYDPDKRTINLYRLEYDIEAAQKKIMDAGLPERLAQRLSFGR